jgi:hypothetical protein
MSRRKCIYLFTRTLRESDMRFSGETDSCKKLEAENLVSDSLYRAVNKF